MPLPTPEEVAAARARLLRKPQDARIVPAPYDVITVTGQQVPQGSSVWRYASSRQYGGPLDMSIVGQQPDRPVEYSYRSLSSAASLGWTE